ncbi:MAG: ATP-binding protein [Slackia sp.]|nr:ATP-binding protein [Slackia sp.]
MFITNDEELALAVERMRAAGTDLFEFELKSAADGFPKSTVESVSAFANTYGGAIVFGIQEKGGFHAVEIDVKRIQSGSAQAARELVEPPQAVHILVLKFEEKPVVVVNVPEAPVKEKPCYVKKLGQMQGSYIRTGDGDHKMSIYEIDRFIENQYRVAKNDTVIVEDASLSDLDPDLLSGWLSRVRATTLGRASAMTDEELMVNRRVATLDANGILRPTIAGLLALGSYPQAFFPRLNVIFTAYPTPQKGELGTRGERFIDSANIDGPIPAMVVESVRAASRNMKHGAIVKGGLRENVPDYPLAAIREAIANALMHRDYSVDAQGAPVSIDLYPDRLEISNPGGLFGSLTVDKLGEKGATASRNQFLARILEDAPYTDYNGTVGRVVENRGSGYPTINRELNQALMPEPIAHSSLDAFDLMFRHRKMTDQEGRDYSRSNVEEAILSYLSERESASSTDIAQASGLSVKTIRRYLSRLLESGTIEAIGATNSPNRRYRINR